MDKTQEAALRQALEAMEYADACLKKQLTTKTKHEYAQDLLLEAGNAIREALADSALDRMAENARELGLDYEPPCKTGSQCTSKCPQCEQPEAELKATERQVEILSDELSKCSKELAALKTQQQEPVAYIHRQSNHWEVSERFLCDDEKARGWTEEPLYTSPPASKPWVGLTDEEIEKLAVENGHATFLNDDEETGIIWFDGDATPFARAIEQKLREKNGGAA